MDVLNQLLILCINTPLIKWVYPQNLSTRNKQQYIKINMINTICYLEKIYVNPTTILENLTLPTLL